MREALFPSSFGGRPTGVRSVVRGVVDETVGSRGAIVKQWCGGRTARALRAGRGVVGAAEGF